MAETNVTCPRVLIVSHDILGACVAGPGLRYMELAAVLAETCHVTLAGPMHERWSDERYGVRPLSLENRDELDPLLDEADVVVANVCAAPYYPQLVDVDIPWVVDAYIPLATETLAQLEHAERQERLAQQVGVIDSLNAALRRADMVLCGNERQRDLYLGMLAALGRLNAFTYDRDPTLDDLVAVVPFGLPPVPPTRSGPALRGAHPAVPVDAKIILWGGGIWNWFDPLSLLRALPMVRRAHPEVRVHFPGPRHPNERVPAMEMYRRTRMLSDELGLTDRVVVFGEWVPHEERGSYLLEADVAVSLHGRGIEPRFALRTRVLDYLWASVPMVVSEGDSLAELVRDRDLGIVVPPEAPDELARALCTLLEDHDPSARRARIREAAAAFTWHRVAEPLIRFCRNPHPAADRASGYRARLAADRERASMAAELDASERRVMALQTHIDAINSGRYMRLMAWIAQRRIALLGKDRRP